MAKPKLLEPVVANSYLLVGQFLPGWEMVKPLPVEERIDSDGSYLVSEALFPIHGLGDTSVEARRDYAESLVDLYGYWESDASNEYIGAEEAFALLNTYVRPISEENSSDAHQAEGSQRLSQVQPKVRK